jgi:hypothetical protein
MRVVEGYISDCLYSKQVGRFKEKKAISDSI